MTNWIPCGGDFIEADVIRWKEAAWEKRRRLRGRAVNAGERMVVAEVIRDRGDGWVEVLIRDSTVLTEKKGWLLKPLPKNSESRRRRRTIERGNPERLLWSDESARAALHSKFLAKR
ncbi:MAG: hypothetical protein AAB654_19690 [Acidobacteriota bacterium]